MATKEPKQATCKNCGELFDVEAAEGFDGACSLHCGIEAAWEEQVTRPKGTDIATAGF